jgi:hypothetical protein
LFFCSDPGRPKLDWFYQKKCVRRLQGIS